MNKILYPISSEDASVGRGYDTERVKIPFLGTASYKLSKLLRPYNIQAISTPFQTIRQLISKPKSWLEDHEKKNVIYQLDCDCGELYVGESARTGATRWKEHAADWKKAKQIRNTAERWNEQKQFALKSAFKNHLDHRPQFKGEVLKSHKFEFNRLISEAIFIKRAAIQGASTIVNTNSGREIDPVFDQLISKLPKLKLPMRNEDYDKV